MDSRISNHSSSKRKMRHRLIRLIIGFVIPITLLIILFGIFVFITGFLSGSLKTKADLIFTLQGILILTLVGLFGGLWSIPALIYSLIMEFLITPRFSMKTSCIISGIISFFAGIANATLFGGIAVFIGMALCGALIGIICAYMLKKHDASA